MDNDNKKILWFIAAVSTLTLILLSAVVFMNFNKTSTGTTLFGSKQTTTQGQLREQTPNLQPDKLKTCMDACISTKKSPPDCLKECGGTPRLNTTR